MTSKGERSGRRLVVHRRRSPEKEHAEPPSMKLHLPKFQIAQKLPLALIGSALVVGLGIGTAAYMIGLQAVEAQRAASFDASVQSATDQVNAYFKDISVDLTMSAARPDTVSQIDNMTRSFIEADVQGKGTDVLQMAYIKNNPNAQWERDKVDGVGAIGGTYDSRHKRFHPTWRPLMEQKGYEGVLLFNADGTLLYTVQKNADFAGSFAKGGGNPLSEGPVGVLMREAAALKAGEVAFADFSFYEPAGRPESFMATPVYKADTLEG